MSAWVVGGKARTWLCAGLLLSPVALADRPADSVRHDAPLREGVARYHYYQKEYLPALSELMVARAQDRLADRQRADGLEGAIRLGFGMADSARRQLEQALTDRPGQRDAARFYLGKLYYLRGDLDLATATWAQLGEALKPSLALEHRALRWQTAIRQGQVEDFNPVQLRPDQLWHELQDWAPNLLHNLGGERARAGDLERARDYYRALTDTAPRARRADPEYRALRDRAHTAAGYTWLLEGESARAEAQFEQVRLDRPEASRALLGYGWAAAEQGDYHRALRPWQALSERRLTDSSVQEVLLALPHAYEQLGAPGEALAAYDRAETQLETELNQVTELSRSLDGPALLGYFTGATQDAPLSAHARQNWLSLTRTTVASSNRAYLQHWVNQSQFQAKVQAVSDLLDQRELLSEWRPKLDHYAQLLQDKQALRQGQAQQRERDRLLQQSDPLLARRADLAARLDRIESERDYLALAGADTQSLQAMVEAAQARLERLAEAGADVDARAERLRRYRGIVLWQAAQNFPDNLWRVQKQQQELEQALAALVERRERVEQILARDPDIRPHLRRMTDLDEQIVRQLQALDQSLAQRTDDLATELQAHLERHRERIGHYLARVRLAGARLQDAAMGAEL